MNIGRWKPPFWYGACRAILSGIPDAESWYAGCRAILSGIPDAEGWYAGCRAILSGIPVAESWYAGCRAILSGIQLQLSTVPVIEIDLYSGISSKVKNILSLGQCTMFIGDFEPPTLEH